MRNVQVDLSPKPAWGRGLAWLLFASLLLTPTSVLRAQNIPATTPASNLDIALITFGPGTQVWERFGHNAILVHNRDSGKALLYNYGMFDFAQKNFYLNFARGHMLYSIDVEDPAEALPMYVEEGRWVVQQDLNLSPTQRQKLADYLAWNARPENAQYHYDYFTANCSTRVRDALDNVLGGVIRAQLIAPSRGFTYRMDALRLMRPDPALMLGIDAGLGPFADQRLSYWAESFVPMQFMRYLRDVKTSDVGGQPVPLVARETVVSPGHLPPPPPLPPNWIWQALAIGIAAGFGLLAFAQARTRVWARVALAGGASPIALVCGLSGLILIALWALTDHVAAWHNENLLLLNPLCILLIPAWIGSVRKRWQPSRFAQTLSILIVLLAGVALILKLFPAFAQDNLFWIALLLPIHLALAVAMGQMRGNNVARTIG